MSAATKSQIHQFVTEAGGPDELRRLLLLFYTKMSEDALIGYFFTGKDLVHTSSRQADFILAAGGFIPRYEGRGPASAHTELPPIWKGHFDRRLVILREVLQEQNIPQPTVERWIQFEESFRHLVVQD